MISLSALVLAAALVPAHVQSWYYYGLLGRNADVPPATMVRYADWVEDDGMTAEHAMTFKRAGGRFAIAYMDPAYVPYCHPPFAPPAGHCEGPIGDVVHGEDAWFHGPDGTRVRHRLGGEFDHQEALNPASPAAHRAWRQKTDNLLRAAPALDFVYADDAGGTWLGPDGTAAAGWFYGFNTAGVEIKDTATFIREWTRYLGESRFPMIINGYDDYAGRPAYGGTYLKQPFILGESHEHCFRGNDGIATDRNDKFRLHANALLGVTAMHRFAVCMMTAKPTNENRVYALAAWWLAYDPLWSVIAPIEIVEKTSVLPELDIVPTAPTRTATSEIGALRAPSGAYAREFLACYQRRAPIGGCAAIVNPTAHAVPLPALSGRYARALALSGGDVFAGGRAEWGGGVPAALAPGTAVILLSARSPR